MNRLLLGARFLFNMNNRCKIRRVNSFLLLCYIIDKIEYVIRWYIISILELNLVFLKSHYILTGVDYIFHLYP